MYVVLRMTMQGWWSAYKAPSGLMGEPEFKDTYETFLVEDVKIHIGKYLLETHMKNNAMLISLEGYGRFIFQILEE